MIDTAVRGAAGPGGRRRPRALTALLHRYRTEFNTPVRQALAIGLGLYIGCSPFIGFHLLLALFLGRLFGLNRFKVYLAANISIPLIAPALYGAEIQIGAWLRLGHVYSLSSLDQIRSAGLALDILLGSVVVGAALGVAGAVLTYFTMAGRGRDPRVVRLVEAAAERYLNVGLSTWEFAHGKLEMDQVYLDVLRDGVLPPAGTLYDIGCGQGLMLSLLAAARAQSAAGAWPSAWPAPPQALALHGIELRPRVARRTRSLLEDIAVIEERDVTTAALPPCQAVLIFDVLHLLPRDAQDRVLAAVRRALVNEGGVLVVREANAGGGWRFRMVRLGNRLTAIVQGRWRRRFAFRTAAGWEEALREAGFTITRHAPSRAGPFANFVLYARADAPVSHRDGLTPAAAASARTARPGSPAAPARPPN